MTKEEIENPAKDSVALPDLFSRGEVAVSRTVWAVMLGSEVDSLWDSEEDADKRMGQLEGAWRVFQMGVYNFTRAASSLTE